MISIQHIKFFGLICFASLQVPFAHSVAAPTQPILQQQQNTSSSMIKSIDITDILSVTEFQRLQDYAYNRALLHQHQLELQQADRLNAESIQSKHSSQYNVLKNSSLYNIGLKNDNWENNDLEKMTKQSHASVYHCTMHLNNVDAVFRTPWYLLSATYAGGVPLITSKHDFNTLYLFFPKNSPVSSDCLLGITTNASAQPRHLTIRLVETAEQPSNQTTNTRAFRTKAPVTQKVHLLLGRDDTHDYHRFLKDTLVKIKADILAQSKQSNTLVRIGTTSFFSDGDAVYFVLSNAMNSSGFLFTSNDNTPDHIMLAPVDQSINIPSKALYLPNDLQYIAKNISTPIDFAQYFQPMSIEQFKQNIDLRKQYFVPMNIAIKIPTMRFWDPDLMEKITSYHLP